MKQDIICDSKVGDGNYLSELTEKQSILDGYMLYKIKI